MVAFFHGLSSRDKLEESFKVRNLLSHLHFGLGEKQLKNPFEAKFKEELPSKLHYIGELDLNDKACGVGCFKYESSPI